MRAITYPKYSNGITEVFGVLLLVPKTKYGHLHAGKILEVVKGRLNSIKVQS